MYGQENEQMKQMPLIVCDNLVKIYKTKGLEVMALQGLDITINAGEMIAIVGNSGSGKTTFLNMIGGLDKPTAGRLYVDGQNLFTMNNADLVNYKKKTVGFIWQNNARNLLPYLTAFQNIQLPMLLNDAEKKEERALKLLELVGLSDKKDRKLSQLSGGEQQRAAIAIAIANNPKILLADEPTGSVDAKTGNHILDIFRKINKEENTTVIIVTHNPELADKVTRIVSIRDGKTSSEKIMKESYRRRLQDVKLFSQIDDDKEPIPFKHEEYAILDRFGRVQIPADMLEELGIKSQRVKMQCENGRIIITPENY